MDENPAGARAEALCELDNPQHVLLRSAEFCYDVGDEQAQLVGNVVVAGRQLVVRIANGDKVIDLGAALSRVKDVGGLGAARELDFKILSNHWRITAGRCGPRS